MPNEIASSLALLAKTVGVIASPSASVILSAAKNLAQGRLREAISARMLGFRRPTIEYTDQPGLGAVDHNSLATLPSRANVSVGAHRSSFWNRGYFDPA